MEFRISGVATDAIQVEHRGGKWYSRSVLAARFQPIAVYLLNRR
jgi:hypothetical protein